MKEREWLRCPRPQPMLEFVRGSASDRKLRLYAVACFRQEFGDFPHPAVRGMIHTAEEFADGAAGDKERVAACSALAPLMLTWAHTPLLYVPMGASHLGARSGWAATRAANLAPEGRGGVGRVGPHGWG